MDFMVKSTIRSTTVESFFLKVAEVKCFGIGLYKDGHENVLP